MSAPRRPGPAPRPEPAGLLGWFGLLVVVLAALLLALLETLLVPLYAGSTVVPVSVVLAVAGNIVLPRLGKGCVPRTGAAALPFVAWLVVAIGFGVLTRPEGDVILPGGGPGGVEWVTYGTLLAGALAGAVTLVTLANPLGPPRRQPGSTR